MSARPGVNWTLVGEIGGFAALILTITIAVRLIGPVAGIHVSWLSVLSPLWVGLPVMALVAVLSKWWTP